MTDPILSIQALSDAARAQFPEGDFGHEEYRPALERLLRSLHEEAQLTPVGLRATSSRLITALKHRRQLVAHGKKYPESAEIEIENPIFILGFPRTGTTLLHNLFASDATNRPIRLWEMQCPYAEGEKDIVKAMEETRALVDVAYRLAPGLMDIHPLKAEWPDECSWLFRNCFSTLSYGVNHFIPGYVQWLLSRDMTQEYRYFRKQLQAILSLRPGSPLVLKDPLHLWHLPALLKTFPDARVIQLHRAPQEVVPSGISLVRIVPVGEATIRPLSEIVDYYLNILTAGLERMLVSRAQSPQGHFIDLGYRELVANPEAAMEKLYAELGMDFSPQSRAGVRQWLSQGRRHTGKHHYQLADFGLTARDVEQRFVAYHERFANYLK
uniref:Sulfotransferase family protein n=1 Tax=Candidatus Kentrum sp. FM TaxID=2126340 RepID=A0A450WM53_9GAMM|nr:MAG: Sulfotransferase family protein [Candidatus Kentron sp. FM]VFJ70166.1 MAG: Sulfotransferase family protein [Candidatus Kentron sp. FM]VFK18105.1 MAG: Sulfotransferase family protein [Candidatus Kentron sp. FM]